MNTLARRGRGVSVPGTGLNPRVRAVLRAGGALILLAAAAVGAWLVINSGSPNSLEAPTLAGTWELCTLNGESTGETSSFGVVSQRMELRAGKVRGETVLRSSSDSAAVALPFPDESVERVIARTDETGFRVLWSGTYDVDEGGQITVHIGKAVYFVKMTWQPGYTAVEFNQDVILTVHGAATYRRAGSPHLGKPSPGESPAAHVARSATGSGPTAPSRNSSPL